MDGPKQCGQTVTVKLKPLLLHVIIKNRWIQSWWQLTTTAMLPLQYWTQRAKLLFKNSSKLKSEIAKLKEIYHVQTYIFYFLYSEIFGLVNYTTLGRDTIKFIQCAWNFSVATDIIYKGALYLCFHNMNLLHVCLTFCCV